MSLNTIKATELKIVDDRITSNDKEGIIALANDIEQNGLLQPIGIDKDKNVIFGRRRLKALQYMMGNECVLTENLHFIYRDSDVDNIVKSFSENVMRKDYTFNEKIQVIDTMRKKLSIKSLSKALNLSQAQIKRILLLLPNIEKIQNFLNRGCEDIKILSYIVSLPEDLINKSYYLYESNMTYKQFLLAVDKTLHDIEQYPIDIEKIYKFGEHPDYNEVTLPVCKGCEYLQKEDLFSDMFGKKKICMDPDCFKHKVTEAIYEWTMSNKDKYLNTICRVPNVYRHRELPRIDYNTATEEEYIGYQNKRTDETSYWERCKEDYMEITMLDLTPGPTFNQLIDIYVEIDKDLTKAEQLKRMCFGELLKEETKEPSSAQEYNDNDDQSNDKSIPAKIDEMNTVIEELESKNKKSYDTWKGKIVRKILESCVEHIDNYLTTIDPDKDIEDAYLLKPGNILWIYNYIGNVYPVHKNVSTIDCYKEMFNEKPDYVCSTIMFLQYMKDDFFPYFINQNLTDNHEGLYLCKAIKLILPKIYPLDQIIADASGSSHTLPKSYEKRERTINTLKEELKKLKAKEKSEEESDSHWDPIFKKNIPTKIIDYFKTIFNDGDISIWSNSLETTMSINHFLTEEMIAKYDTDLWLDELPSDNLHLPIIYSNKNMFAKILLSMQNVLEYNEKKNHYLIYFIKKEDHKYLIETIKDYIDMEKQKVDYANVTKYLLKKHLDDNEIEMIVVTNKQ